VGQTDFGNCENCQLPGDRAEVGKSSSRVQGELSIFLFKLNVQIDSVKLLYFGRPTSVLT
jgi:hypothetical protein